MSAGYCKKRTTMAERRAELAEWEGDPWHGVLVELNLDLERQDPNYNMYQVKAKFDELRFYYYPSPGVPDFKVHIMDRLVARAQHDCWELDKRRKGARA